MFKRIGILKEFGPEGHKVFEEVALRPSLGRFALPGKEPVASFTLRIDADEYSRASFEKYYPLFGKYRDAITIFFNAFSFRDAAREILRCRDAGCEIQSHGYYHHTYRDYDSNRYNIGKARRFFRDIGIETRGFVSPCGRWSRGLMRALEDEGYVYASEFSYDYMGYPSYPYLGARYSTLLEIPVFPVAPELFFREKDCNTDGVVHYYKKAVDEMIKHDIPVIVYAHTDPAMPKVPGILEAVCDHAINVRKLAPAQMGGVYDLWKKTVPDGFGQHETIDLRTRPDERFLGRSIDKSTYSKVKDIIKNALDYETITPAEELRCHKVRKVLKLFIRRIAGLKLAKR